MRLLILGASGGVGRLAVAGARERGWTVRAQTRDPAKIPEADGVQVAAADPCDAAAVADCVAGCDAILFALGVDRIGPTTLFSDATRVLIPAMASAGVRRLVAITGVGAGETRGHGGWLYDRVIFPLLTRHRYADKDRQEALIRESGLDWTILRPAPFAERPAAAPLEVHTQVPADLTLRSVTRRETAEAALDAIEFGRWRGEAVFFGRP